MGNLVVLIRAVAGSEGDRRPAALDSVREFGLNGLGTFQKERRR
jgi:hypothetical protein